HRTHRPLHSFPTRRSSDLTPHCAKSSVNDPFTTGIERFSVYTDPVETFAGRPPIVTGAVPVPLRAAITQRSVPAPARLIASVAGDRKSTRLNSSHRTISYA